MKIISPIKRSRLNSIKVVLNKPAKSGDTILDVSIADPFLYPHQNINLIGDVSGEATYIMAIDKDSILQRQKLVLSIPLNRDIATSANITYFSTFSVFEDNEDITIGDAVRNLKPIESIYPISTLIDQPQNYSDCGKPGLITGEDFNKLNRLNKNVEFGGIDFVGNVMQTIALIQCGPEYKISTDITVKRLGSLFIGFRFTLNGNSFESVESEQYLEISHYEQKISNTPQLAFYREQLLAGGKMLHFIRVKFGLAVPLTDCEITVGVNKFDNLLNQKTLEFVGGAIESKPILFDGKEINNILEGVVGFTSSKRYNLTMSGESPIKPTEILSGDLNAYKTPGYFFCKAANASKITNRPTSKPGSSTYDNVAFLLIVNSDTNGNVRQQYTYLSKSESTNREFTRIFSVLDLNSWLDWSEVGKSVHTHKLEELTPTDLSLHFSKALKDSYDKSVEFTNNGPWKLSVPTVNNLPDITLYKVGDVVSVQSPAGLYMCENVASTKTWVPKTTESLKIFDNAVRHTVAGLISPELYDSIKGSGIGKNIADGSKTLMYHIGNAISNYAIVSDAFDLVKCITVDEHRSPGDKSIAIGFGTTSASGDTSVSIGTNLLASGNNSVLIGNNIENNGDNSIGIGSNLIVGTGVHIGLFNEDIHSQFSIGNGTSDTTRHNIFSIIDGIAKAESFAKFAPRMGARYAYAMLEDGTGFDIEEFATKDDIVNLENKKANRGANFKVTFTGVDNSVNEAFILMDDSSKVIVSPNGKFLVDYERNGTTVEGIYMNPSNIDGPAIKIPVKFSKTGNIETIIADQTADGESTLPIDITNAKYSTIVNITALQTAYPIYVKIFDYSLEKYSLTYSNGVKIFLD